MSVYGSAALQAAVGVDPANNRPLRKAAKNPLHYELLNKRIAELKSRMADGGLREAVIRGLLFAGMGRAAVDERGFEIVRRIRKSQSDVPLSSFKATVRDQFHLLSIDTEAALAAIPSMLPADPDIRREAFGLIGQVLSGRGEVSAEDERRLERIGSLFGANSSLIPPSRLYVAADDQHQRQDQRPAKAS